MSVVPYYYDVKTNQKPTNQKQTKTKITDIRGAFVNGVLLRQT